MCIHYVLVTRKANDALKYLFDFLLLGCRTFSISDKYLSAACLCDYNISKKWNNVNMLTESNMPPGGYITLRYEEPIYQHA